MSDCFILLPRFTLTMKTISVLLSDSKAGIWIGSPCVLFKPSHLLCECRFHFYCIAFDWSFGDSFVHVIVAPLPFGYRQKCAQAHNKPSALANSSTAAEWRRFDPLTTPTRDGQNSHLCPLPPTPEAGATATSGFGLFKPKALETGATAISFLIFLGSNNSYLWGFCLLRGRSSLS